METTLSSKVGPCKFKPLATRVESAWRQLLERNYDELLSTFALNFNLRRYTAEARRLRRSASVNTPGGDKKFDSQWETLSMVGQCRSTLSNPC